MRLPTLRRAVAVAAATLLTASGLAACGGDDDAALPASEQKEFVYWSMWQESEPVAKVIKAAIASFEDETGIKVDVQWQGREVLTKVKAALNTDDVPDLVDQGFPAIKAALGLDDQAMDLSSVYDMDVSGEAGRTVRDAVPEAYDELNTAESLILVPYYVSAFSIWYSGRDYPELVDSPPETWSDFTALFDQVKANGQAPIAQDADLLSYDSALVDAALVRTLGVGNLHALVSDESAEGWDAPEVHEALDAIAQLAVDDDYLPGYDSSKWPAMEKAWAADKAAFLHMGSWVPYALGPELDKDYDLHTFNFPTFGEESAVPVTTYGYAVPSAAEAPDAAKKFIAYFLGSKWLTKLSTDAEILTPDPNIDVPKILEDQQAMLADNDLYLADDGIVADFPDLTTRLASLNQGLITGELSADEYVDKAKEVQEQYWKLNG
ncbi:ABC transporter substrate-binding protein [Nocardioides sp. YIM 152315]|uniref:ABC transporter substrate-binding protein n=1 Tax=Nocardioides sp. YIM 152315 TaxID=3031760 RepID=UPI0023DBEA89|nr:ABC transporter substrate-binding protein [Nocardioides sp. YIM 152315]MDF1602620.1 ABC transporter substrate-binding protein [Nocardioides sp. YIM 152315]